MISNVTKRILQIIFPLIIGLLVYAFFYDYLEEYRGIDLMFIVSFIGIGFAAFAYLYIKNFSEKLFKNIAIVGITCAVAPFFVYLIYSIVYCEHMLFVHYPIISACNGIFLGTMCFLIGLNYIYIKVHKKVFSYLRVLLKINLGLVIIVFVINIIGLFIICIFTEDLGSFILLNKYHFTNETLIIIGITFFASSSLILTTGENKWWRFTWTYTPEKFIIYLRAFKRDSIANSIDIEKILHDATHIDVMKIGNPTISLLNEIRGKEQYIDSFYIPISDWKKHVSYYMSRATYIFTVIDNTEGIRWELFTHTSMSTKTIYYIHETDKLADLIDSVFSKIQNSQLLECIKWFSKQSGQFAFYIKNNTCYYGDVTSIINLVINSKKDKSIRNFALSQDEMQNPIVATKFNKYFLLLDSFRIVSRLNHKFAHLFGYSLFVVLRFLFVIFKWVVSVILTFGSVIYCIYTIYYSSFSWEILIETCILFCLGYYTIKD